MSRNIPPVREWTLRYWQGKRLLQEVCVDAPTKLLARMKARNRIHTATWREADRVTVKAYPLKAV